MNDYNQDHRYDQSNPPPQDRNDAKSENVYTVGAGAGQQSTPNTSDAQRASQSAQQNPAYTAPSGNTYSYSSYTPPYGQPSGYTAAPQQKPKKSKKGAMIALAVAGAILLSLLMGIGGASIAVLALSDADFVDRYENADPSEHADASQGEQNNNANDASLPSSSQGGIEIPQNVTIKKNPSTSVITTSGEIGDEDLSYADVVALVENSVVEITTNYVVSGSMFSQYVSSGAGSGVIISQDGDLACIVTNNHVIEDATSIVVRLKDGTELEATLIGADAVTDLAILTVKTDKKLTTATLGNSDSLIVGQEVIAIGNPLGQLGGTVTNGIISALEREVTIGGDAMTLLQTNAAVNPGNSGGGLFNMRGELIGVVNAKSSGDDVEGLGFAIPVNTVYDIITELIEFGYVRGRPALGITVGQTVQQYFMQIYTYIIVTDPGHTALRKNDVLYSIDGTQILSTDDISAAISGKDVGDVVEIKVLRDNKEVTVQVELIEFVPSTVSQTANVTPQ